MAFITIRRKTLIAVLSIVLCAVVVAATAATVIAATRTDNGITIVIDAESSARLRALRRATSISA